MKKSTRWIQWCIVWWFPSNSTMFCGTFHTRCNLICQKKPSLENGWASFSPITPASPAGKLDTLGGLKNFIKTGRLLVALGVLIGLYHFFYIFLFFPEITKNVNVYLMITDFSLLCIYFDGKIKWNKIKRVKLLKPRGMIQTNITVTNWNRSPTGCYFRSLHWFNKSQKRIAMK